MNSSKTHKNAQILFLVYFVGLKTFVASQRGRQERGRYILQHCSFPNTIRDCFRCSVDASPSLHQ